MWIIRRIENIRWINYLAVYKKIFFRSEIWQLWSFKDTRVACCKGILRNNLLKLSLESACRNLGTIFNKNLSISTLPDNIFYMNLIFFNRLGLWSKCKPWHPGIILLSTIFLSYSQFSLHYSKVFRISTNSRWVLNFFVIAIFGRIEVVLGYSRRSFLTIFSLSL